MDEMETMCRKVSIGREKKREPTDIKRYRKKNKDIKNEKKDMKRIFKERYEENR